MGPYRDARAILAELEAQHVRVKLLDEVLALRAENAALVDGIRVIAVLGCLYSHDYRDRGGTCEENDVVPGCATCQARALLKIQALGKPPVEGGEETHS